MASNGIGAEDPVVVYDLMREAATRLTAVYVQRLSVGGLNDPAMIEMRRIRAQVEAIDTGDRFAQRTATVEFNARFHAMLP